MEKYIKIVLKCNKNRTKNQEIKNTTYSAVQQHNNKEINKKTSQKYFFH